MKRQSIAERTLNKQKVFYVPIYTRKRDAVCGFDEGMLLMFGHQYKSIPDTTKYTIKFTFEGENPVSIELIAPKYPAKDNIK